MEAFCAAISSSFSTWVKVAVCAMNSLELAGFAGSWYFIWATRSFRNMSFWLPWSLRSTVVAAVEVTVLAALGIGVVIAGSLLLRRGSPRRTTWIGWWSRSVR